MVPPFMYIYTPYGSTHCLKRYKTPPQIIPETLPKNMLGSIGIYNILGGKWDEPPSVYIYILIVIIITI